MKRTKQDIFFRTTDIKTLIDDIELKVNKNKNIDYDDIYKKLLTFKKDLRAIQEKCSGEQLDFDLSGVISQAELNFVMSIMRQRTDNHSRIRARRRQMKRRKYNRIEMSNFTCYDGVDNNG